MKTSSHVTCSAILVASFMATALAQLPRNQADPNTTRTIPGDQLPPPDAPFEGTIRRNAIASTSWWPPRVVPPDQPDGTAPPNVLLIMTDDVGFGAPSTFGGVIPTPALQSIADAGLRYTRFHATALCSPSRASLLTGRNHHAVGFGEVSELASGFPGYDMTIPKDAATIARILREHGYATSWFGKNHNTPGFQATQTGPFDQWPTGMGFDYFYGFMGGDTNQWQPGNLYRNTTRITPDAEPQEAGEEWNLTTAMADEAIHWIHQLKQIDPTKPFFCYFAPGGTHAPHHPTQHWVNEIEQLGLFDGGWNELRERIFRNQVERGIIPRPDPRTGAGGLTPWPALGEVPDWGALPEWDNLADWYREVDDKSVTKAGIERAKELFIRQVEVYAAYLAYTDHEIGRVIDTLKEMGEFDNTLVIYISGDNGGSVEGTINGSQNEVMFFNQIAPSVEEQLPFKGVWGTKETYNHMATPWAWAFSTPFKWTKQVTSHFGGTRQGVCISWPRVICRPDPGDPKSGMRTQFHHIIDIAPTILDAIGIEEPDYVDGIKQNGIEGVSMTYTFGPLGGALPSRRKTQYFEMQGLHAIYDEGWYACTTPVTAPWSVDVTEGKLILNPAGGYEWELYNIDEDWTQNNDLAGQPQYAGKLRDMQQLFMSEARKYQVLPLNANVPKLLKGTERPSLPGSPYVYTAPMSGVPVNAGPRLTATPFTITATFTVPEDQDDGVLLAAGGRFAGWSLYLKDRTPTFTWNLYGLEDKRATWVGRHGLKSGTTHTVVFEFKPAPSPSDNGPAVGRLTVNKQEPVIARMRETIPTTLQFDETFDVGSDTGTSVNVNDYSSPSKFTGKIKRITIEIPES